MTDLLERLRQNDPAAHREVRAQHFGRIQAVCHHLLRAPALAEEVAEDVFADFLVERVATLRHSEAIPAYLRMMAVRRCADLRRFQARQDERDLDAAPDGRENAEALLVKDAETREEHGRLAQCLRRLTPRSRQIMRLRFHHDLTQEEIGQRIGASKQYAGRVLAKGLEVLRLCMKEQRA